MQNSIFPLSERRCLVVGRASWYRKALDEWRVSRKLSIRAAEAVYRERVKYVIAPIQGMAFHKSATVWTLEPEYAAPKVQAALTSRYGLPVSVDDAMDFVSGQEKQNG